MKKGLRRFARFLCEIAVPALAAAVLLHFRNIPLCRWAGMALCAVTAVYILYGLSFHAYYELVALSARIHPAVRLTMPGGKNKNITVTETDQLYILYPNHTDVRFVTRKRPSRSDKDILLCAGATFRRSYEPGFSYKNIAAVHVENGILREGYTYKGLGAFTWYDNTYHFAQCEEAADELARAAEKGGCGFQQHLIISDGKIIRIPMRKYIKKRRCYRVLADIDGRLCVIDARKRMSFPDFAQAVLSAGVRNAIYLDTGNWIYAWYRDNSDKARTLIGLPWPLSDNWIVFRREHK